MKPNYKWSKKKLTLNGQFPPSQNYHIFFFRLFQKLYQFLKKLTINRYIPRLYKWVLICAQDNLVRYNTSMNYNKQLSSMSLHVQWNLFQTFFCYQSQRIIHVSDLCTLYFRMLWTSCNIMLRWRLYRPHTCSMTINGPLLCWFWASLQLLL